MHGADPRVAAQPACQLERGDGLLAHAHGQGAQPAQRQVGLHHAGNGAAHRPVFDKHLAPLRVGGHHHAHHEIGVATEILGRRMQDGVGSKRQRLLQHRRRERVVDDREHACSPGCLEQPRELGDPEHGIGGRL